MTLRAACLALLLCACSLPRLRAESPEDVLQRVSGSVVVLRTTSRTVLPQRPDRFTSISGVGSGVYDAR